MSSLDSDKQDQQDEMAILKEILGEDCVFNCLDDLISGQLRVKVRLPFALKCGYVVESEPKPSTEDENSNDASSNKLKGKKLSLDIITLNHLPALELYFTLPSDYPSISKPMFTLSCKWISRNCLSKVCEKLDCLWEENEGMAILYTWYTFLQDDLAGILAQDAGSVHDLTFCYHKSVVPVGRGKQCSKVQHISSETTAAQQEIENVGDSECSSPRKLKRSLSILDSRAVFERINEPINEFLLRYEKEEMARMFLQTSHACEVCLSEKRGAECLQFECQHVYCKPCLLEFFSLHIREGSLDNIRCPNFDCKVVPHPYQVKLIVNEELFQRYDRLLLAQSLDNMADVVSCPRVTCGRPVVYDPTDKLGKCLSCDYAFCRLCKSVYHGIEPCKFRSGEAKILYDKYTGGTDEEKKQLEKKYGKKQLELMVEQTLSEEWVTTRSKPCPHCKVPIEKFEGCNKVTCFKCLKAFCWLCSTRLNTDNPYFHFNDPTSKCYNNLFHGEQNAHDDDNEENEEDALLPEEWARLHRDVQFVREALGQPQIFFV